MDSEKRPFSHHISIDLSDIRKLMSYWVGGLLITHSKDIAGTWQLRFFNLCLLLIHALTELHLSTDFDHF